MNMPLRMPVARGNVRPLNGHIWNKPGVQYTEDFYIYGVRFGNLPFGSAAVQQSITIQSDSHFEWIQATWFALVAGQVAPFQEAIIAPLFLQVSDGGSGRQLSSVPIPLSSHAGLGREPYYLPVPRIFLAKSQVTFNLLNNDPAAGYNQVQLNLHGRKIFESGSGTFPM